MSENVPNWEETSAQLKDDAQLRDSLTSHIATELELAKQEGREQWSEYLNGLSGIGVFSIRGNVYVPRYTKQFGDWVLLPDQWNPDIEAIEACDTDEEWPYTRGHLAWRARHSHVQPNGLVALGVEADTEEAEPRVVYPEELDRFSLLRISTTDVIEERDERFVSGVLRFMSQD